MTSDLHFQWGRASLSTGLMSVLVFLGSIFLLFTAAAALTRLIPWS